MFNLAPAPLCQYFMEYRKDLYVVLAQIKEGGVQAFHFGKTDFELGVGGEGWDTSRNFEGSFGSIRTKLPM